MRKSNLIFILASAALAATSCEGLQGEDADPVEPFVLSVDKATIEANGDDLATFTIKDANGTLLTSSDKLKNASFRVVETDTYLTRKTNTFSSLDNGTYTIEGMYLGKPCQAPVTVTAVNRRNYELFYKTVAIYRLTATWCPNCPSMTQSLTNLDDYTKSHIAIMAFHSDTYYGIKEGGNYIADILLSQFSLAGYPSAIYSLSFGSINRTRNEIMSFVWDELHAHPARTGIKVSTVVNGDKVSVTASVKASAAGTYDLGCALLCDNLPGDAYTYEQVYNNAVRSVSGNYRFMSTNAFDLAAGAEKTDIAVNGGEAIPFELSKKDDYSLVLFTLVKDGDKTRIDNCVKVALGESVEYRYND